MPARIGEPGYLIHSLTVCWEKTISCGGLEPLTFVGCVDDGIAVKVHHAPAWFAHVVGGASTDFDASPASSTSPPIPPAARAPPLRLSPARIGLSYGNLVRCLATMAAAKCNVGGGQRTQQRRGRRPRGRSKRRAGRAQDQARQAEARALPPPIAAPGQAAPAAASAPTTRGVQRSRARAAGGG